ncbi:LPXTG cell wall anchor domain-containing protein, partial [Streptococcus sp. zg-JUN1979]|uniref:LPXTG cell wall anchor domain-containing protein n=1 Tax=Streptococcus sp. zg-JUN1979 TaxID=3391450 RepID=UPI0039B11568
DSVIAKVDITLADGTVIKAGTDLAEYTERTYNEETGLYELTFKEEFLKQIPRSSEFGADAFLVVKRIAVGEIENEYTLYVNGNPVKSEVVRTTTPEPVKPETSQPVTPVSQTPATPVAPSPATPAVAKAQALPQTGEESSILAYLAGGFMTLVGLVGVRKRKEN